MSAVIYIKRAYEDPVPSDGFRILVDRLWPRGISKEALNVDLWMKDIAPSNQLRKWFGHDPDKFDEFSRRYIEELDNHPKAVGKLISSINDHDRITFIYAAKNQKHNNAVVLNGYLLDKIT